MNPDFGNAFSNLAERFSSRPLSTKATKRSVDAQLEFSKKIIDLLLSQNERMRNQLRIITEKEEKARAFAYFDELTGLPNRRLLKDRLHQMIVHAERQNKKAAVLMIDLNGFKEVNDTLGHSSGDQLLRLAASRLSESTRASDTVCRYGGDEFVIALSGIGNDLTIEAIVNHIKSILSAPYLLAQKEVQISASIGCAIFPDDALTGQALIDCADEFMYRVKISEKRTKGRIASIVDPTLSNFNVTA